MTTQSTRNTVLALVELGKKKMTPCTAPGCGMRTLHPSARCTAHRTERCQLCGEPKPADRSCDCFDNHCQ